jgi:predicted metal-binding membrane protein
VTALLANALRHDRLVVGCALLLVAALSWAWLLAGAGMDMDAFEMTRHSTMRMPWLKPTVWTPGYALLMFSMWWVMMVAMMLPAATPVILLAAALNRRLDGGTPPYGSSIAFTTGYLLAWGGFSAIAVLLQWWLERSGLLTPMMVSASELFAGCVLVAAGLWQFSPWKTACLRHCRSPVEFLTRNRRPGNAGALAMGWRHGLYCLGCCWFLMALLFVGGVMNLYWIIGLTIYVWVEKMLPGGPLTARIMGVLLAVWGLIVMQMNAV